MKQKILGGLVAAVLSLGAAAANAASLTFDFGASAAPTLTQTAGYCGTGFLLRNPTPCASVSYASTYGTPDVVEIEEGESYTFDFLTFTGSGSGFATFDVAATLAFDAPVEASTTGNSNGSALLAGGYIVGGTLNWYDLPDTITLADGSVISISFQGGAGLLLGHSVTTTATISVLSVADLSAVPLPAGLPLVLTGLGAFAFLRRKKRAA